MDAPVLAPLWLRVGAAITRRLPAGRYRAAAWLTRRVAAPFLARLPHRLGGSWFVCDPGDAIAAQAYFGGVYEPQETAITQALLAPGATFVDVGANWGYFTLLAARRLGARGAVIALEPDPRMCGALRANVALNGLSSVTVLELAAADRAGTVPLLGFDQAGGNYGLSRMAPRGEEPPGSFAVTASTLDDVFAELRLTRVSLLKMDIEGGEARALAGLRRSFEAGVVDRLLLEVHPQQLEESGSSVAQVFELLERAGFRGWTVDHSPRATRRAAYARRVDVRTYLRPLDARQPLDAWAHCLCARRGIDPL